tara:strand:+ start:248 stop:649 length:402 start_codon:yes stop_codon:yes gene_type:complete
MSAIQTECGCGIELKEVKKRKYTYLDAQCEVCVDGDCGTIGLPEDLECVHCNVFDLNSCDCECGVCHEKVPLEVGEEATGDGVNGNLCWCNGCGELMCRSCHGDSFEDSPNGSRCDDCGAREAARRDGYSRYY